MKALNWTRPGLLFVAMALILLALAWYWHLPMMVWDHLDLVPLLQAQEAGTLNASRMLAHHGGHIHGAAYLVLLLTTTLTHGWPMADVLASWALLLLFAALLWLCARNTLSETSFPGQDRVLAITVLLTLTTLHLPNLQWGWQVAVFISLLGVAVSLAAVTVRMAWGLRVVVGALGILLAISSFATGIAVIPAMLAGLFLNRDLTAGDKLELAALWALCTSLLLYTFSYLPKPPGPAMDFPELLGMLHYGVNYLGGGIVRFAKVLAVPASVLGTIILVLNIRRLRGSAPAAAALWTSLAVFAVFAAAVTAYGRAPFFGPGQAFVLRYGSFASLYWLAVFGAIFTARDAASESRLMRYSVRTLVVMFVINSLHFIPQTRDIHTEAAALRDSVVETWPDVPEQTLNKLYFGSASDARERLQYLREHAYPPFDE